MRCRLTNLSKNGHTRTDVIEGDCTAPPKAGERFSLLNNEPLETDAGQNARWVSTSPVGFTETVLDKPGAVGFYTESGTHYLWEPL